MTSKSIRLSTAEALVKWMTAQRAELLDGTEVPLFAGVFAIFGHGNVLGLGTALHEVRDTLPTWRGQTEEGMALAAVAYARAMDRRQVMAATSSVGPGALNMVTAAGVAHANRLPILLLPGDTFTGRGPDPVLQQVEHYGDPTITANDAFRPVSRYFDRITKPEQLLSSLPQVARVLTDPVDAGPVVLALPQDVQVEEFDFPRGMFEVRVHRVPRTRPDEQQLGHAARLLRTSERPLLILGGGVRYSGANLEVISFAETHGIPIVDTVAGRTLIDHDHPLYAGPLGIIGSSSANVMARDTDVVLAVGTRLQDFMTSSWTAFAPDVRILAVNAAGFDAVKHSALSIVGDARAAVTELHAQLNGWAAAAAWTQAARSGRAEWDLHVDSLRDGAAADGSLTYAQVLGAVNDASTPDDYLVGASGGFPGEIHGGWRSAASARTTTSGSTMDLEYGFSCMGYEIAGAWGAAMARAATHAGGIVTTLLGDGSYLMLNSELYSAAFSGHPFVAIVCDNGGFAVIHRLQTNQGATGFNNLLADCSGPGADGGGLRVDFAMHARSLGCLVEDVPSGGSLEDFRAAYDRARAAVATGKGPVVVICRTHPSTWTDSGAWWEVGVPVSLSGRAAFEAGKVQQLRWVSDSGS
ncbi:MAG: 3D-(3,5/4)-trihydroxycyclohexane-1,2-dione acylhydrolase (decyclizing) [Actinomycetota bacterium]|nr:3D-(3,5/4)-trihydroxycyclohexane-1,2-dione acylhydrolase (decyclizing) [Actinomycetota bacterium]